MKTIAEQIASFEAKRAASKARMDEVMSKAAEEGRTLNEAETQEYDALKAEVKAVDDHLVRLKEHEAQMVERAVPIIPAKVDDPARLRKCAVRAASCSPRRTSSRASRWRATRWRCYAPRAT